MPSCRGGHRAHHPCHRRTVVSGGGLEARSQLATMSHAVETARTTLRQCANGRNVYRRGRRHRDRMLVEFLVVWVYESDVFEAFVQRNKSIADDLHLRRL